MNYYYYYYYYYYYHQLFYCNYCVTYLSKIQKCHCDSGAERNLSTKLLLVPECTTKRTQIRTSEDKCCLLSSVLVQVPSTSAKKHLVHVWDTHHTSLIIFVVCDSNRANLFVATTVINLTLQYYKYDVFTYDSGFD